jgi:hypothetical protein
VDLTPNAQMSHMALNGGDQEERLSLDVFLRTKRNGMFFDEETSEWRREEGENWFGVEP